MNNPTDKLNLGTSFVLMKSVACESRNACSRRGCRAVNVADQRSFGAVP
jgi:hypothetical protein